MRGFMTSTRLIATLSRSHMRSSRIPTRYKKGQAGLLSRMRFFICLFSGQFAVLQELSVDVRQRLAMECRLERTQSLVDRHELDDIRP